MMTTWVRAGRHTICLDDIGAIERHSDGGVTIYLRRVRDVALTAAEAVAVLPHLARFARLEDLARAQDEEPPV